MDHRILLHLEGDCVVKTALSKRVLGVFSGASHIFFFGYRYLVFELS